MRKTCARDGYDFILFLWEARRDAVPGRFYRHSIGRHQHNLVAFVNGDWNCNALAGTGLIFCIFQFKLRFI